MSDNVTNILSTEYVIVWLIDCSSDIYFHAGIFSFFITNDLFHFCRGGNGIIFFIHTFEKNYNFKIYHYTCVYLKHTRNIS